MAGRLVNALGSSALAAEAFSDLATLRHMLRFEAALAEATAEAGADPEEVCADHRQGLRSRALRSCRRSPRPRAAQRRSPCRWSRRSRRRSPSATPRRQAMSIGAPPARTCSTRRWCCSWARRCHRCSRSSTASSRPSPPWRASIARRRCWAAPCCSRRPRSPSARRSRAGLRMSTAPRIASRRASRKPRSCSSRRLGQPLGTGRQGRAVMVSLARRLKLDLPPGPWFTQRVRVAALAQDAALVVGALAKAARDISLMMQVELGEASEPSGRVAGVPRPCRTSAIPSVPP